MAAQPKITDLIPTKKVTLALWFLAGVAVIAGLEALYYWMPKLASLTSDGRIAAFDLDGEGSLGAWFSSLMLLSSSLMCLVIWSLRRHKLDDYHGRYRVWLWAAFVWFTMSADEACSLHEGFKELMSYATGHRLMGDGSVWWVGAYLLVLGTLAIRLLLEIRSCKASTTFFILAGMSWATAVLWQLDLVVPASGARSVMVEEGCEMLGDIVLLLAMTVHARYVLFDVQGLLPDEGKRKKTKRRKVAETSTETAANDSAKEPAKPAVSEKRSVASIGGGKPAPAVATRPSGNQTRIDPPQDPLESRRLSKAERRAQRRSARDQDER